MNWVKRQEGWCNRKVHLTGRDTFLRYSMTAHPTSLSEVSRSLSEVSPKYLPSLSEVSPESFRIFSGVFPKSFQSHSEVFPESFRSLSGVFPKSLRSLSRSLSRVFPQSLRGLSEVSPESLWTLSKRSGTQDFFFVVPHAWIAEELYLFICLFYKCSER